MNRIGKIASLLLVSMLIAAITFMSCSNDNQPPAPDPEPEFSVHAYEAVGLTGEFGWGATDHQSYAGSDWEADYPIERNLALFLQGVGRTFEALDLLDEDSDAYDEDAVFNPRLIEAGMHLKVRDEGFSVDVDSDSMVDFLIDYFDVLMEGDISSFTQLISMASFSQPPEELIDINGHIALSGKVTSTADPAFYEVSPASGNPLRYNYSLYADVDVGTDIAISGSTTGTISGELKYSGVMNLVMSKTGSTSLMPQAITIEVRPFVDRSLVTIQNAMDDIDEMVEPTAADVFDALKPAVWGSTNDWCIRITRSVGDAFGVRIAALSHTWDDADALQVIEDFVSLMSRK